jgi:hypothetical protein
VCDFEFLIYFQTLIREVEEKEVSRVSMLASHQAALSALSHVDFKQIYHLMFKNTNRRVDSVCDRN